ncbi:MAG: hypothetical protein HXO80_03280, partial [Selenomonas sp.]|nr:hypothetical protein [Selenomonas sp.]
MLVTVRRSVADINSVKDDRLLQSDKTALHIGAVSQDVITIVATEIPEIHL